MKKKSFLLCSLLSFALLFQFGMANRGQYDEEAREQERLEKEARDAENEGKSTVEKVVEDVKNTHKVEEPASGTEEPTKIRFKLPGT